MLKVNETKILIDYENLVERRNAAIATIETDARSFAQSRGYNEEVTEKFVEFVKNVEKDGLSDSERAIFDYLNTCIEDVADEIPVDNMEARNEY